jgi:hypothetical protein
MGFSSKLFYYFFWSFNFLIEYFIGIQCVIHEALLNQTMFPLLLKKEAPHLHPWRNVDFVYQFLCLYKITFMKKRYFYLTAVIVVMILINLTISTQVTNSHNKLSLLKLESKADDYSSEVPDPDDDPIPNGVNPIELFFSSIIDFLF